MHRVDTGECRYGISNLRISVRVDLLLRTSPVYCIQIWTWAQYDVFSDRICSIFSKGMRYKDLPCIWSLLRSRLSPAKSTFVRYWRPSKVMSITLPYADS